MKGAFVKFASVSLESYLRLFNGTAASETLKECFGRFSNLTLSADAFAKRADCAVTNGVEDTEKASGYLQEFYAHARMAEGGMLSFFRADSVLTRVPMYRVQVATPGSPGSLFPWLHQPPLASSPDLGS